MSDEPATWGTSSERQTRIRIAVSVAAYAYEIANKPVMADLVWDGLAQLIKPEIATGHPVMDEFFMAEFTPDTGMWIHQHPELDGIKRTFEHYYNVMRDYFEGRKL